MSTAQHPVQDLDWLVTDFAERVRHVAHAVVVSADGFALAFSATLPRGHADQLAAVTSGLAGLADGAARTFGAGEVIQTAVEMEAGLMVTMPVGQRLNPRRACRGRVRSRSYLPRDDPAHRAGRAGIDARHPPGLRSRITAASDTAPGWGSGKPLTTGPRVH